MTPAQCRAGRGLLDLKQSELALAASLGVSTVIDFERDRRPVSDKARGAIRAALEAAGVVFLADGETAAGGPGVRLSSKAGADAKLAQAEKPETSEK